MSDFKSYSQAGQDQWVHSLLGDNGTFLDIGASHPTEFSNTYGLERVGWTGWCMEIEHELCERLEKERKCVVWEVDACKINWDVNLHLFMHEQGYDCSYLSLDIDEPTIECLRRMPLDRLRFNVITIEHDAYRFGDKLRTPEREILTAAGYVLVRPDVANKETPNMPFEDWWIHGSRQDLINKARSLP